QNCGAAAGCGAQVRLTDTSTSGGTLIHEAAARLVPASACSQRCTQHQAFLFVVDAECIVRIGGRISVVHLGTALRLGPTPREGGCASRPAWSSEQWMMRFQ